MTPESAVEGYRLSPPQRHVWLQHGAAVGPHRVCATVSIDGPIDPAALERAVRASLASHEVCRTTYQRMPGMTDPVQVIHDDLVCAIEHEEIGGVETSGLAARLDARRQEWAAMPIDLERGPVMMARLLTQSADRAALLLMWPSLAADVASVRLLVRQIAREIGTGSAMAGAVRDRALQHVDLSEWQHELLAADGTAAGRDFWRQLALDAVTACRLPLRQRKSGGALFAVRTLDAALPDELIAAAAEWAADQGQTIGDVLLACWQLLVWRLTGRGDVCVGVESDGRALDEISEVIGPLAKTLPVRLAIDSSWTCARLVERSHAALQEHRCWHQAFAWSLLDGASTAPVVPACPLAFELVAGEPVAAPDGVRFSIAHVDGCLDRFDIKLSVLHGGGRCDARWLFDEGVHTAAQMAVLAEQYAIVLQQVVAGTPSATIDRVDIRGPRDRAVTEQLATASRTTAVPYDGCVHALFDAQAHATPARVAAVCDGERVTYAELRRRAGEIARLLRARGVGVETRVAVLLDHSIDLLAAIFGVLESGGAFVPLVPGQSIARLARLADRTRATLVVTHQRHADEWPAGCATRPLVLDGTPPSTDVGDRRVEAPTPDSLCYVMFTSGSTGEPKGVMISHRAFVNYVRWCADVYFRDGVGDVPLHGSVGFDATLTALLAPLCCGGRVVVIPARHASDTIGPLAASGGYTFVKVTPAHLGLIAGERAADRLGELTGRLVIGGEALDAAQLAAWRQHAPSTRVINEYGPTEATVGCITYEAAVESLSPGPVPIGRPLPGVDCGIVDDYGHPAAAGVAGELYLGGVQVARGYEGRPDLTAERFVPAPLAAQPGARWYRTGDRVRLRADGVLEYLGRRDDQVKLHGYRLELGEIEAACRQQPGVRDAAVALHDDGQGTRRIVAYAVVVDGALLTIDRLRDGLRAVLPDYMLPSRLVVLDALPLSPHGKVDRSRLPAPADERPRLAEAYEAPATAAEATLAAIWAEVLHVARVGRSDNFFALGGDSILSLQMVARAARANLRLAPRLVFEHQTIAALAAMAEQTAPTPHADEPVAGPLTLTPIQHRFFDRPRAHAHHYNHAVTLDVVQPLEPVRFHDVWLALQRHHDALRTRYRRTEDGWLPFIEGPEGTFAPTWVDASAVDPRRRDDVWRRVTATQTSLDLENGPVARAVLVQWGAAAPAQLLVVIHHLVVDGASWAFLLEDLRELCRQAEERSDPARWTLSPRTTAFKTWAERLATFAAGGGFDDELPLWLEMNAAGASMPADHERGRNDVRSERSHRCSLSAAETEALVQHLPRTLGVHVAEALIGALIYAVARSTGAGTWRIDVEGHGREPIDPADDLSRTVGWFTSIHPIRVEAAATDDPIRVLRAVRSVLHRIPNAGIGYGALRYLAGADAASRLAQAPTPEIVFNYWGQIDRGVASAESLRPTRAPAGATRAGGDAREYMLDVSASITEGRLHVWWTYSASLHRAATIERLAGTWLDAVRGLLRLPATHRALLQTPADFPLANLSQTEVDELVAPYGVVSDVYPLSPLQEAILFERLYDDDGASYVQQCHARVRGALDRGAFRRAWEDAVARHDTLRTGFVWERAGGPLAIVCETAALPWHEDDWRELSSADQERRLTAFLAADASLVFALGRPSLMRVALLQLGEAEWEVVWTSHHLVLDGWSGQVVLSDVFASYFAARAGEPAPQRPIGGRYADYIGWLRDQDHERARVFWTDALAGIRDACVVAAPATASLESAAARRVVRTTLPASLVDAVQTLAQANRLTLNTCFVGTWAVLLAYCTKKDDVVFGTVVSGRPPHLPGIETMTGLFANTLPLRARPVRSAPALSFFADCQRLQVSAREHEYVSLASILGWIGLSSGVPPFDTLFAYENYPAAAEWSRPSDVHVVDLDTSVSTAYPLGIDIGRAGRDLVVTLSFDEPRVDVALATFLRDGVQAVLSRLIASPASTVGHLFDALDECAARDLAAVDRRRRSHRDALQAIHDRARRDRAGLQP
jgi:amino acid adenylation domain-containing protein/non-ribosomal peptide synthase protein (TIGR01720 family)